MFVKRRISISDLTIIGMLAALCIVSTMLRIYYTNDAFVHLGTAAIFTSAILFGGKRAGIAAALGSAIFDIMGGVFTYTLWSFFIKGIAAFMVGTIAHSGKSEGKSYVKNILGCVIAAAWTLTGYIVAWTVVLGSFEAAVLRIPTSIISSSVGLIVAIPLAPILRTALIKAGMGKFLNT